MSGRLSSVPVFLMAIALVCACSPSDPLAEIQEQRARWNVSVADWSASEDGAITVNVRVSGPPNSKLDVLTYRIRLLDAVNQTLEEVWRKVDLTQVPRGGPKDLLFKLHPEHAAIEGLTIDLALDPTPDEQVHIEELKL
jgi:hypothetical protein